MAKKQSKKISEMLMSNMNVKSTWAEYADNALVPKYYIFRYDDRKNNRFYYFKKDEEVIVAAGSTTVFGIVSTERERIDEWKKEHPNWQVILPHRLKQFHYRQYLTPILEEFFPTLFAQHRQLQTRDPLEHRSLASLLFRLFLVPPRQDRDP